MANEYFSKVRAAPSTYVDDDDGQLIDARLVIARFGEDAELVIEQFWKEHKNGNFDIVPLFSHGKAPRPELCSKASLREALKTAKIEPNSIVESHWKAACEAHKVPFNGVKAAP